MAIQSRNTRLIVKNSVILYVRMLILMIISLYTSRVVLQALGVEDYGIYNAVGGFITMFDVFTHSLSAAISRFITFELGKGDKERVKVIFSTTVIIQSLISFVFILLAETVGLWFFNTQMTIPEYRQDAAFWVYQCSLIAFVWKLLSVPYNACIIAHEKMNAFAFISIFEGVGRLAIAFIVFLLASNHLIMYALLLCILSGIVRFIYNLYCKRSFEECGIRLIFDKKVFCEIFAFSGWNFVGGSSFILNNHGVNVLLNIFCGPTVNAARGIAIQVDNALLKFTESLMTAIRPQITKSYANNDRGYMMNLIFLGSRYCGYLMAVLSLPLFFETKTILALWLVEVPDYTVSFVRLVILNSIISVLSYTLITAMLATGDIKRYQFVVGGINLLGFPLCYIVLSKGLSPSSVFLVLLLVTILSLWARLIMLRGMIDLPLSKFVKEVILDLLLVFLLSSILPSVVCYQMDEGIWRLICCTVTCLCSSLLVVWTIGCKKEEKRILITNINKRINRK